MLPTISASPSPNGSPSTPRQQRSSRKSGIAIALQAQSSQSPSNSNGGGSNKSRNTHARHLSMPPQQRPTAPGSPNHAHNTPANVPGANGIRKGNNNTSNHKRSSAPLGSSTAQMQILQNSSGQNFPSKQLNNSNNSLNVQPRSHFPNQKQKNQGNNGNNNSNSNGHNGNNPSSKAKRVQRRKEITATTESLAKVDVDVAMNQSPLLNPSSPPSSSTDSDDSESAAVQRTQVGHSHHSRGNSSGHQHQLRASKYLDQLSSSPPQRPNSAPVISQPRKGMANAHFRQPNQVRNSNTNNNNGMHTSMQHGPGIGRKTSFGSGIALPIEMERPNVVKASSADKIMLADRVAAEKNRLYAGPTFHNSPAPNSLPIPAFTRSLGGSPVESTVETIPSPSSFFAEAASPQLNSMRQRTQSENTGWTNHHSMPGMHFQRAHIGLNYQLPDRMATSSYSIPEHPMQVSAVDQLTEISQNLRTLLKIQSQ
ncbi:hypothetical protein BG004_004239 [Podila humilis]|nr:hypothetical protein BG004_004239 [Podila humilis]